jgi:ribosomal protein S18 acetylase RimI-like enzyme
MNSLKLSFIKCTRANIPQLAEIDFQSEHPGDAREGLTKKEMEAGIRKRFDEARELFYAAKVDRKLVGYATLILFFPGYKHAELYWLAVKKSHQCRGIGSALVEHIATLAKRQGFRKLCLYTGDDLKPAHRFYKKNKFCLVNTFPDYYGFSEGNTTAALFCRRL